MNLVRRWPLCGSALVGLGLAGCMSPPATTPMVADAANPAILNVADAAIAGKNPAMALKISQSVLAAHPDNLPALYHEADAYYALNRCQDTIAAFRLALSIDPHSATAQTGLGRCLLRRNAAAAEQAFTAATIDDPQNAAAFNDLGIARDLQGRYAAATNPYEQSLRLAPGYVPTEVNLGLSLALSGDSADALQYLGPLATGPDATAKIREDYATALIAAGRLPQAEHVLAVDLPPSAIPAFMRAARTAIDPALFQTQPPSPPPGTIPALPPNPFNTTPLANLQR
ncbi:MAG: hypothetical protein POH28_07565 [Acidocella sp.]|nr:hypothetical protein [Acidocella sp.]